MPGVGMTILDSALEAARMPSRLSGHVLVIVQTHGHKFGYPAFIFPHFCSRDVIAATNATSEHPRAEIHALFICLYDDPEFLCLFRAMA